jgi:hypothetical protein
VCDSFLVSSNEVTSLLGAAEWRGLAVSGWLIDLGRVVVLEESAV